MKYVRDKYVGLQSMYYIHSKKVTITETYAIIKLHSKTQRGHPIHNDLENIEYAVSPTNFEEDTCFSHFSQKFDI